MSRASAATDHGQDAGDLAPTLRGLGPASAHNGGGQVAIAPLVVGPMAANNGSSRKHGHGFGQQDWESGYCIVPPLVARSTRGSAQTLSPGFNTDGHIVAGTRPRRLTPRECERLQGLPDDWTLIDHRGKPAADGPRYRAIGNSMAVPVMRWILDRLRAVA